MNTRDHHLATGLIQEGAALHRQGRLQEAADHYRRALEHDPARFDALNLLGLILLQGGDHARAAEMLQRAVQSHDGHAPTWVNLGFARQSLGEVDAALHAYDVALTLDATQVQARYNRGQLLARSGRYEDALRDFRRLIGHVPGHADAHRQRIRLLERLGRWDEALQALDDSMARQIDGLDKAHFERAVILYRLGRWAQCVEACDRAIAADPGHFAAWRRRGLAQEALLQWDAALQSYERSWELEPGQDYLLGARLRVSMQTCDWQRLAAGLPLLARGLREDRRVINPFPMLALRDSPQLQARTARLYAQDLHPGDASPAPLPARPAGRKLRVAYFSADFHEHATAHLMAGLFEHHDREGFEWLAFSFGPDSGGALRTRLASAFDRFIDIRHLDDAQAARQARELGVDLAIDLKGFTANHRAGIFAHRAAPIQVSYLGYPGTTGAPWMDYLIADPVIVPEGSERFYSEKLVLLPRCYQPNDRQRAIADVAFTRAELGLPEAGFVFCCFNNSYKIGPEMFASWMRILHAVEGSVLWLLQDNETAASNLRAAAVQHGIEASRLVFAPRLPLDHHLARHRQADLFLDTLPCNAHTTASDALWAGLPVLTQAGRSFAARVCASLLHGVGLAELVVHSRDHYESLAIALARDPARLKDIRRRLEASRSSAQLFDVEGHARDLERACLATHARHQAGLAPDRIVLPKGDSPS